MKKFVIGVLAIIGALSIASVLFVACVGMLSLLGGKSLPSRMVLEIDFEQGVIEAVPDDFAAALMLEEIPELRDIVDSIDRAAEDRRVKGLVARIGGGGIGLAHFGRTGWQLHDLDFLEQPRHLVELSDQCIDLLHLLMDAGPVLGLVPLGLNLLER